MKLIKHLMLALCEPYQILHVRAVNLMLDDGRDWSRVLLQIFVQYRNCISDRQKPSLADFTLILTAVA